MVKLARDWRIRRRVDGIDSRLLGLRNWEATTATVDWHEALRRRRRIVAWLRGIR